MNDRGLELTGGEIVIDPQIRRVASQPKKSEYFILGI